VSSGTNFANAWRDCSGLTSFPVLDVSSGTNFTGAWRGCFGLTTFPVVDVSIGTDFTGTWFDCSGLTTFPVLDLSSGTDFTDAWRYCTALVTFDGTMLAGSPCTNFTNAFNECALNQASVDSILVTLNTNGASGGTLDITGGTSSAPSAATGEPAIDALRAKSWTVNVVGGY